ncbi:MAG: DUF3800 domain-containing protein [Candidatus Shapirobacteria bacterium]
MNNYTIFIDESGMSSPQTWQESPYFSLVGLMINDNSHEKFNTDLNVLKKKYFKDEEYVLHGAEIIRELQSTKQLDSFCVDLKKFLKSHVFFLFFINTNKKEAFKKGWSSSTILTNSYKLIIANLIKFLIAKNYRGRINSEASYVEQDIYLYKNFFHFLSNGIKDLSISPEDVKKHLTSISFVTKLNNDPEEQIVDLYGVCGKTHALIKGKQAILSDFNPLINVLYSSMLEKLFVDKSKNPEKSKYYSQINSFIQIP